MALTVGDHITYCLVPDMRRYDARVRSLDETGIALDLGEDSPSALPRSHYVMISDPGDDIDYYSEISGMEGRTLRLRRMWTGKRGFFRVDSVFPLIFRKVEPGELRQECRTFAGYGGDLPDLETPDETVSPRLWKMLVDINTKLGMILEQLRLAGEGLAGTGSMAVNISATGLRFSSDRAFELGDELEVKMLLPTNPSVGILAHGRVVRVETTENNSAEISLHFIDLVDDVRDVIIQYTLKRQREVVRRSRERDQEA